MAERRVFRDPITGRFISEIRAFELGVGPIIDDLVTGERRVFGSYNEYNPPQEPEPEPEPFWRETSTERGAVWDQFERGRDGASAFDPPPNAHHYRVLLTVENNPDYQRGIAATGWIEIRLWAPSLNMIDGVESQGFHSIRFDET